MDTVLHMAVTNYQNEQSKRRDEEACQQINDLFQSLEIVTWCKPSASVNVVVNNTDAPNTETSATKTKGSQDLESASEGNLQPPENDAIVASSIEIIPEGGTIVI